MGNISRNNHRTRKHHLALLLLNSSKVFKISDIGLFKSICVTGTDASSRLAGKNRAGFSSNFSRKIPFLFILALIFRSAEQLTPKLTGHDAPCRGKRITRTSWTKYFPPNWAPILVSRAQFSYLLFKFEIPKPSPKFVTTRVDMVKITT